MAERIFCGTVDARGKHYRIEWDPTEKDVWAIDSKGMGLQIGEAKATDEKNALKCATEMLRTSE